jgi:hypothetical protein
VSSQIVCRIACISPVGFRRAIGQGRFAPLADRAAKTGLFLAALPGFGTFVPQMTIFLYKIPFFVLQTAPGIARTDTPENSRVGRFSPADRQVH